MKRKRKKLFNIMIKKERKKNERHWNRKKERKKERKMSN